MNEPAPKPAALGKSASVIIVDDPHTPAPGALARVVESLKLSGVDVASGPDTVTLAITHDGITHPIAIDADSSKDAVIAKVDEVLRLAGANIDARRVVEDFDRATATPPPSATEKMAELAQAVLKQETPPKNDPKHRTRDLTDREKNAVRKWPCDGVRRYKVRKSNVRSTYSEAYEGIFIIEGGHTEPGGGRVFTPGARKRIRALNENYLAVAHNFVIAALHVENAALETALEEIDPKPETTPEHGQESVPSSPAAG